LGEFHKNYTGAKQYQSASLGHLAWSLLITHNQLTRLNDQWL